MANTPDINAPQAAALAAYRMTTTSLKTVQASPRVVYNVPASGMNAAGALAFVAYRKIANTVRAAQSAIMVVYKGQVDNPKLKSWTYTMDGHDFFVLKLGTYFKTLVYDMTMNTWAWWTTNPPNSLTTSNWRASTGMNWLAAGSIPYTNGSDVIVGDDSAPVLWVLDPNYGLDDSIGVNGPTQTFERSATGQITTQGRNYIPVYEVDLSFSAAEPALSTDKVSLTYSDDSGATYQVADGPSVVMSGNYYQMFQWRSLGQIRSPGRLFKITDNGAFPRIDDLTINGETGQ